MKKFFAIFLLCLVFSMPIGVSSVFANESEDENTAEEQLDQTLKEQLDSVDFGDAEDVLEGLSEEAKQIFQSTSFLGKLEQILAGDFDQGFSYFFQAVLNTFFSEVLKFLPLLAIVVMIALLSSIIGSFRSKNSEESVGKIVNFVSFLMIVVIVMGVVIGFLTSAKEMLLSIQSQMNAIFPILLTFLTAVGGTVSVGIFQPSMAILSNVVVQVFVMVIMPLFVFLFVLNVVGNLSPNTKLEKMSHFLSSLLKWGAGICFALFLGILGIQGIVAGSFDSVSIKATKFAVKSYVPIIGGYLSDGFNVVLASSVLIKNVVGIGGILLLCSSILLPVVMMIACSLMLKFASAILEPLGVSSTISSFLSQTSKTLSLLVMLVLGVAFAYFVTIGLVLGTANVF